MDSENIQENMLFIQIPFTKTNKPRSFTVTGVLYDIVMKYIKLRPVPCQIDRFFLQYSNGFCSRQPMGINTFGAMPKEIANYLNLTNADKFKGHSFRRTSATLLADAGADLLTLQRHGSWKSAAVAMSYIEESIGNKNRIFHQITGGLNIANNDTYQDSSSTSGYISNQTQQQVYDKSTTHNRKALPTSTTVENRSLFGNFTTVNDSTPHLLFTEHYNGQKSKHSNNDKQEIINISRQQQQKMSDNITPAHDRRVSSTSTTVQNRYIFW